MCISHWVLLYWTLSFVTEPLPTHDPTGKSQYEKICGSLGVTPISYFVRHINDHAIVMRYHGLGPAAAKALALVLRVSFCHLCRYKPKLFYRTSYSVRED